MSIVVALMNQKGGSNKTTNSINIADGLSRRGYRVLLADLDEGQDSSLLWSELNETSQLVVKGMSQDRIKHFIERHREDYDWIIIDTPPRNDHTTMQVLRYTDLALITVCPSPIELWALRNIVESIQDRQEIVGGLIAKVLLSRCKTGTTLVGKSLRVLKDLCIEPMNSGTTDLEIYKQVFLEGETVFTSMREYKGLALSTARKQVEAIINEIEDLVGVPANPVEQI